MDTTPEQVGNLVGDLVKREKRAARRSFVYTGVALLLSGLWLTYTVYKTQQLKNEAVRLESQIAEKKTELQGTIDQLNDKQQQLKSMATMLGVPPHKLVELFAYGYNADSLAKTEINLDQVEKSLEADKARQQIASSTDNTKRRDVTIEYFLKDVDREKVTRALSELGFKLDIQPPVNSLPTNAMWLGRQVNPQDARLVAFTLMRAGVDLKAIRYFKLAPRADSSLIQVGSSKKILDRPSLTVEDVSRMKFETEP